MNKNNILETLNKSKELSVLHKDINHREHNFAMKIIAKQVSFKVIKFNF